MLVGTDGSFHANNAAQRAAELQKEWKSQIIIFHSINHHMLLRSMYPNRDFPKDIITNIEEITREAGKELLKTTEKMFDKSISSVETRLIEDLSPEKYILKTIANDNIDLVVIGSKGYHSKIEEILLGTVSTQVSNKAPCDVFIIR